MSKHWDLNQQKDVVLFVANCNLAIDDGTSRNKYPVLVDPQYINKCIQSNDILSIWRAYDENVTLWKDGYSVFLNRKTKLTFEHYRSLSKNKLDKLNRKWKSKPKK